MEDKRPPPSSSAQGAVEECEMQLAVSAVPQELARGKGDGEVRLQATRPCPLCASWLDFAATLSTLAVFGVLGVIIRFALEEAFGKGLLTVMEDWSALFKDLPANACGSFFMGFFAFALKDHIGNYSELLLLGLTTGLMGSITTYASWNQDMADMFVAGQIGSALVGLLIGIELPVMSLIVGMAAGRAFLYFLGLFNGIAERIEPPPKASPEQERTRKKLLLGISASLWLGVAVPLCLWGAITDSGSISRRKVWWACIFCPPGVWVRWWLSRLNLGWTQNPLWASLPLGTLLTNVLASALESALQVVDDAVPGYKATLYTRAVQFGVLGCMSTVSTFVAELFRLHKAPTQWRAYIYCILSVSLSQLLSFVVYGIPVWRNHYYLAYPPGSKYYARHGTHGE